MFGGGLLDGGQCFGHAHMQVQSNTYKFVKRRRATASITPPIAANHSNHHNKIGEPQQDNEHIEVGAVD